MFTVNSVGENVHKCHNGLLFMAFSLLAIVGCASLQNKPLDVADENSTGKAKNKVTAVSGKSSAFVASADSPEGQHIKHSNNSQTTAVVGQSSRVKSTNAADKRTFRFLAGDTMEIFVWRNPELSVKVKIRPDGKINAPLIYELDASGRTTKQLSKDIEEALTEYIKGPVVSVMVTELGSAHKQQIRVIGGGVEKPQGFAYIESMTVLDVIIGLGGLSEYAAGNRASIVRNTQGEQFQFDVRLDDLVLKGDISQNVQMYPGDILIVPEARF